jgi:hypothetical protein
MEVPVLSCGVEVTELSTNKQHTLSLSPATITTRLLSAVAKNTVWTFTATTPAPALPTQVQPRRMIGWWDR